MNEKNEKVPTLQDLYPEASPEHLQEIVAAYDEYLAMVLDQYKRIIADPEEHAKLRATLTKYREEV